MRVAAEELPYSLHAVLEGVPVYRQRRCCLVVIAAAVEVPRESEQKAGMVLLVVVEQRAELLVHELFDSGGVGDR